MLGFSNCVSGTGALIVILEGHSSPSQLSCLSIRMLYSSRTWLWEGSTLYTAVAMGFHNATSSAHIKFLALTTLLLSIWFLFTLVDSSYPFNRPDEFEKPGSEHGMGPNALLPLAEAKEYCSARRWSPVCISTSMILSSLGLLLYPSWSPRSTFDQDSVLMIASIHIGKNIAKSTI